MQNTQQSSNENKTNNHKNTNLLQNQSPTKNQTQISNKTTKPINPTTNPISNKVNLNLQTHKFSWETNTKNPDRLNCVREKMNCWWILSQIPTGKTNQNPQYSKTQTSDFLLVLPLLVVDEDRVKYPQKTPLALLDIGRGKTRKVKGPIQRFLPLNLLQITADLSPSL